MFEYLVGDAWDFYQQYSEYSLAILTNLDTNKQGRAVMGRGIAKEATERFPDVPKVYGEFLSRNHSLQPYAGFGAYRLIMFPTKYHWSDLSSFYLIRSSAVYVAVMLREQIIPGLLLPAPGIGNGGLRWSHVYRELYPLYDYNVKIISKEALDHG